VTVLVRPTGDGAAFTVVCRPRAPVTRPRGERGGALRLDVAAVPERGAANDEVVRFLARALELPVSALRIAAGASGREKSIRVLGMTCAGVEARLARLVAGDAP
jgi:uncharacterized protein YggU (UPF0235/DUF167 family)